MFVHAASGLCWSLLLYGISFLVVTDVHVCSCISYPIDIYNLGEKSDYGIFDKARNTVRHPLHELLPKVESKTHIL